MVDGEFDKYLVSFMGSLGIAQILDDSVRGTRGIAHPYHHERDGYMRSLNRLTVRQTVGPELAVTHRRAPGLLAITDKDHGTHRTACHPVPGLAQ